MADTIQINEYQSPVWKYLALFSVLITILFFCAYLFISDPFWGSIYRFIAFAGFAGAVLAGMRMWQKPKTIIVEITSGNVIVHYNDDKKEVKEELFDRDTIKEIHRINVTPGWDFLSKSTVYEHIISFTDTKKTLSFFIYSGRNLQLNQKDSSSFETFLSDNNISVSH